MCSYKCIVEPRGLGRGRLHMPSRLFAGFLTFIPLCALRLDAWHFPNNGNAMQRRRLRSSLSSSSSLRLHTWGSPPLPSIPTIHEAISSIGSVNFPLGSKTKAPATWRIPNHPGDQWGGNESSPPPLFLVSLSLSLGMSDATTGRGQRRLGLGREEGILGFAQHGREGKKGKFCIFHGLNNGWNSTRNVILRLSGLARKVHM